MKRELQTCLFSFTMMVVTISITPFSIAADYELPAVFSVTDVLEKELLESESYKIHEEVRNDGFMNIYNVDSQFGSWEVSSTSVLRLRLSEIIAMEKMREVEEGEMTDEAVNEDVDEIKQGLSDLVHDPEGTLKGAASGVSKMFKLSGEAWKSRHTRDEGSMQSLGKTVSGYSKAKRQFAGQFGVDPYSTNVVLHEELDRLASAAAKGSIFAMTVKALIPGGIGLMISATGLSHSLNELLITKSEVEMRIINRDKLLAMGVDAELTESFLDDSRTTTTQKTYFVGALEALEGVKGKNQFVSYFIGPPSEDVALFRAASGLMYSWYHKNVEKIDRFETVGAFSAAINSAGKLVICAPLDHILWTEPMDIIVTSIDEAVTQSETITGKQLWSSGTISEITKANLAEQNWVVQSEVIFNEEN